MNTYFVANNKTRICAIWQTDKSRDEAIECLDFNMFDIVMNCENVEHAKELLSKGQYSITSIDDFFK